MYIDICNRNKKKKNLIQQFIQVYHHILDTNILSTLIHHHYKSENIILENIKIFEEMLKNYYYQDYVTGRYILFNSAIFVDCMGTQNVQVCLYLLKQCYSLGIFSNIDNFADIISLSILLSNDDIIDFILKYEKNEKKIILFRKFDRSI